MNCEYGARVATNIRWLYLKLAVEVVAELVSARILLAALGIEGYGVFAAVAGSVSAFGFFTGSFETATRRFLCCDLRNFPSLLGLTVLTTLVLAVVGGLVSAFVLPSAIILSLPILGTVLLRILRIPYETCFVVSERMGFFLVVSLFESGMAILAAMSVGCLHCEPVRAYAMLRLLSAVAVMGLIVGFCFRRHPFSRTRPRLCLAAMKAVLGFFGWGSLGSVATLFKGSGIVILLAAYAGSAGCAGCEAASKFGALFWGLIANYRTAYLPGVVKAWADGDRSAFVSGTRHAFWLSAVGMTLVVLPFLVLTPEICRFFLGSSLPAYTDMFVRMVVFQFYFEALSTPFDTAILAAGRIARYEIALTLLVGSSFFIAWLFLAAGLPPWTATGAVAFVSSLAFLYRFLCLRFVRMPDGTRAW